MFGRSARQLADRALEPLYPRVASALGQAIERVGHDVTDASSRRSCLVMAPHADDETLGAGVTIMRKIEAGTPVRVLVATDGSKWPPGDPVAAAQLRTSELRSATALLGLPEHAVTQLDFVDAELDGSDPALVAAIVDAVAAFGPDEVLVTSTLDPHDDHAALGWAAQRAMAGTGVRLLAYPVWQWDRPARLARMLRRASRPDLVRTAGYLERKQAAIAAYRSQLSSASDEHSTEGLNRRFLGRFAGRYEVFFPVSL